MNLHTSNQRMYLYKRAVKRICFSLKIVDCFLNELFRAKKYVKDEKDT